MAICSIEGCNKPHLARGWCEAHYNRWRRNGDPLLDVRSQLVIPAEVRFWAKVNKGGPIPPHRPDLGPCWEWMAHRNKRGYGRFGITWKRTVLAHRFAYEQANGPIPDGLEPDHLCRNHACVNDTHLELVTHQTNVRRGEAGTNRIREAALITHCPQGHPYNEANTYVATRRNGTTHRHCRICRAQQTRDSRMRKKQTVLA